MATEPGTTNGDTLGEVPLLEMRGIGKSFPGVVALREVSLTARAGEVVALLGENGAGKSTLINVLSGVFPDYDGSILLDGRPVTLHSPTEAQRHGISTIHQELNLVPDLSVADNLFLGRERATRGLVRRRDSIAEAGRLLARVGLTISPRRLVRQCRVAEQQLIEVAKALSMDARVLIMDEPTSALADGEVRRLFEVIRGLTAQGVAIIYISHRLEELEELADAVNVLRDGRWIGARTMAGTSRDELIRMMVGRSVEDLPRREADAAVAELAPRLQVRDLTLRGDAAAGRVALQGISFDVRPGQVVGLAGLMGAGRTETLESIFGAHPQSAIGGSVLLDGEPFAPRSPRHAIDRGVVLVAEDRKAQSLVLDASVKFNTSLPSLKSFAAGGWVRGGAERTAVRREVARLGVKTSSIAAKVRTLSGGNQQKVVLAKWLLTSPQVILLDEPTRGIDVGAKSEIYDLVSALAEQGVSFVVASSELPELLRMSDRIVVLCEGRVTGELEARSTDQETILEAAMARSQVVAP
ncbi:MAG: sugar ABC transporter ATP-binding protein [Nakamurella sp.]